jgi:hypothetical protein
LLVCGQHDDAADVTAALANISLEVDADTSYDELSRTYNNSRLNASNVWSTNVQPHLVAEAAAMFESCGLRAAFRRLGTADKGSHGEQVKCTDGERFFAQHSGWNSDVGWLSADDQPTHNTFLSLFQRLGVAETFRPIVGGSIHLYSAFFVVRSECTEADLHVDYSKNVKTRALTLMTPLYPEYSAVQDFQLLYRTHDKSLRRYRYQLGEAIVFGASFYHSTEPGVAALEPTDPEYRRESSQATADSTSASSARRAHAYLCFTFGSNDVVDWGPISETVDCNQTRQISRPGQPDGANNLSLSKLGVTIESGVAAAPDAEGNPRSYGLGGDGDEGDADMGGGLVVDGSLKAEALPGKHTAVAGHPGSQGNRRSSKRQARLPRGILK